MKNSEKVRRAFAPLQPSRDILKEAEKMTEQRKSRKLSRGLAAALLAVMLVIAGATAAYAADLGGIQQKIKVWFAGKQVEAPIVLVSDGSEDGYDYEINYPDGSMRHISGTVGEGDERRKMEPDEVQTALEYDPKVEKEENGRIILSLREHRVDITDQIEEKGIAQVQLDDDYITVHWTPEEGGYADIILKGQGKFRDDKEVDEIIARMMG